MLGLGYGAGNYGVIYHLKFSFLEADQITAVIRD
jgi:hypothetical protein